MNQLENIKRDLEDAESAMYRALSKFNKLTVLADKIKTAKEINKTVSFITKYTIENTPNE